MNSGSLIDAIVQIKTTDHRKVGEFMLRRPMTEWETIALTGNCKLLSVLGLQRKKDREDREGYVLCGQEREAALYYVNQGRKEKPLTMRDNQIQSKANLHEVQEHLIKRGLKNYIDHSIYSL